MFSCEFCKIFENTFLCNTFGGCFWSYEKVAWKIMDPYLASKFSFVYELTGFHSACRDLTEAATGGVLQKKLFLKISQYSQENTCRQDYNFIKKRLQNNGVLNFHDWIVSFHEPFLDKVKNQRWHQWIS